MFQLYDQTRRRMCIASFLALGVLPTVLVAAWCIGRHLPGRVEAEAQSLSWRLGLAVRLHDVQHLRPGSVLYEGVEIADPETGRILLASTQLKVTSAAPDQRGGNRPRLAMVAAQPEIDAAGLARLWQSLQRLLEGNSGRLDADWQVAATNLTLHAADAQTFTDVEGSLETLPQEGRPSAVPLGRERHAAAVCTCAVRNRQTSPPATELGSRRRRQRTALQCAGNGIEQSARRFGPRCRFGGGLWAKEIAEGRGGG